MVLARPGQGRRKRNVLERCPQSQCQAKFNGDARWRNSFLLSLQRRQGDRWYVEIIKPYYPDPSDSSGKFGMVDVRAVEAFKKPVGLDAIKANPRLKQMVLVNNSRLSVQPVSDIEWKIIRAEGGL